MRLHLQPESRVFIDLHSTGVLRAVGHDPTLEARAEPLSIEVGEGKLDIDIFARFRADAIEVPRGLSAFERSQMADNMRGREVLNAKRFPVIEFRGRYRGSPEGGKLGGELLLLGVPRPVELDVRVDRTENARRALGSWEGTLSQLGIQPFRALFGFLKLEDWIRLRVEAVFK
jgi:polyisoprenoid-binding protein YceI